MNYEQGDPVEKKECEEQEKCKKDSKKQVEDLLS